MISHLKAMIILVLSLELLPAELNDAIYINIGLIFIVSYKVTPTLSLGEVSILPVGRWSVLYQRVGVGNFPSLG